MSDWLKEHPDVIMWALGGLITLLHLWGRATTKSQHLETRAAILSAVDDRLKLYALREMVEREVKSLENQLNELRREIRDVE